MAKRQCLMTSYPTDCTVGCYKCDCGGEVALNDYYVSIYDVQRVCDIEGVAAETEEGEYLAEVIRNNLEQMAVVKADVQPVKHGRWIDIYEWAKMHDSIPSGMCLYYWCSECQEEQEKKSNFCPHCGARMDGDTNG